MESNHGHEDFQSSALPTELTRHSKLPLLYYNLPSMSRGWFESFKKLRFFILFKDKPLLDSLFTGYDIFIHWVVVDTPPEAGIQHL